MAKLRYSIAWGLVALMGVLVMFSGCGDPKDPQTWIKQLDDPKKANNAIIQLKKLNDKAAVLPLCKYYEKEPTATVLKGILHFKDKRAIPTLIKALDAPEEKYHNITVAASGLADLEAVEAVPALVGVLKRPIPRKSRANKAKVAAIEALRRIGDKKAVPALIRVAEGSPDKQDFFLNKRAMKALGELKDPEAIPVLIRGLFMASTLQGPSYPMARVALVRMGKPAIAPLVKALKKEDKDLNLMAKELEFKKGVIENKIAIILGDMKANDSVPTLIDMLSKADLSQTKMAGVITALGKIGDKRAVDTLIKVAENKKATYKIRMQACNALRGIGDKRAVPVLLNLAQKGFIEGGYYNLREAGAMEWGRIVGAEAAEGMKVLDAILAEDELKKYKRNWKTFKEAKDRATIALKCKDDAKCYGKALNNSKLTLAQREKAAVMISILPNGREALDDLIKALPLREPVLRLFMLEAAKRIGIATDKKLVEKLEELVKKDSKRKSKYAGAPLATEDKIALAVVKRKAKQSD